MSTIPTTTLNGEPSELELQKVQSLRARLYGELLLPYDTGYEEATLLWNGTIDKTPALVVRPTTVDDVVTAIDFTRDNDILLSVKGGGHNIAGTALADGGLTLDMSRMRDVDIDLDSRVVKVQAGCLLKDVDQATQEHGLATVLGYVSETGVAGLTLGGGWGYLTRQFGWSVDNLEEVEIVTADGEVRRASCDEHEDLFWAVRGAGGNFGVVTEFVFRLHEVGPKVTGGPMLWPAETPEQAQAALEAYRDLTATAPRELTTFCILRRAPPAPFIPEQWHDRRVAVFVIFHSGPADQAERDLAPLSKALGDPLAELVYRRPYTELQSLNDESEPKGNHYYWKSEWVADLSDELLGVIRDEAADCLVPGGDIGFAHIGGALNERPADDGAVGNRDAEYLSIAAAMWETDDPRGEEYRAWVRGAWRAFRPHSTGGHYVNFQTSEEGEDRVRASYGANFDRLVEIKTRYDPDNLFRSNRNIAPTE